MADFDVVIDKTIDQFLTDFPSYVNTQFTQDDVFVSEGATLSQAAAQTQDFLYAVDVTLGENSSGTAVVKEGYLDLTKPGFTLFLTSGVTVIDVLAGSPVTLTVVTAQQFRTVPEGQTTIGISWNLPTLNELYAQRLSPLTGSAQSFDLIFDPVSTDSETVYEVSGYGAASTTLDADFEEDHDIIRVVSLAGFSAGDVVEVEGGGEKRYYKVLGLHATGLVTTTRCNISTGFPAGATVKQVTTSVKTKGVDYTMDYSLGIISLINGRFTPGNEASVFYTPLLQDLDHFELYRVNGNETVDPSDGHSRVTIDAVLSSPTVVPVDTSLSDTSVGYADSLNADQNGETRTYYLFSVDTAPNYSYPALVMVETLPSIPTNPSATTSSERVELLWDDLPSGSDDNTDGFNVYRCDGSIFDAETCLKVNSDLIPKNTPYFDDSDHNATNRRPPEEVPYPQNGMTYSYKIESEDTVTDWDVGTKNADQETGTAVLVASKTL